MIRLVIAALGALLCTGSALAQQPAAPPPAPEMPVFSRAQSQFLLRCGGCHGTVGLSPPRSVPILRGKAGWFLCTPAGRDYIVRLPNVAKALLDDQGLADVLNFVAFDLGEASAPKGASPFTAEEIRTLRARPLNAVPLVAHRTSVVREMVRICGAPRDLLIYGSATKD